MALNFLSKWFYHESIVKASVNSAFIKKLGADPKPSELAMARVNPSES